MESAFAEPAVFKIPVLGPLLMQLCPRRMSRKKIEAILRCPDNDALPRVPNAGTTDAGAIVMHNGLKLLSGSVGSWCQRELLRLNHGVAEPQHERAFAEVLRAMGPSPLILDVGARNGFYAMWMKLLRPGARCVVIEPDTRNLSSAKKNFALNKLQAQFFQAYVGLTSGRRVEGVEVLSVEELSRRLRADHINLLHADIEGYELELLKSAAPLFKDRAIDYLVLSTHTRELHAECKAYLESQRYLLLAEVPLAQSYDDDGLLVARRKELKGLESIPLSQKPAEALQEVKS